ncbi:MAG: NUDIX domain-containing protein [Chlamydiia bacterium]|nr:NUDIX domain-containing protein [Chlamydiia bacterium]
MQATTTTKRTGASVNSYLILYQGDKILFGLRQNTGYCDGMWSLVAGHVENGESATQGMIREAKEEIGIDLIPSDLKVVHIMHRQTNRFNIDVFFECHRWEGDIQNNEPEKCETLEFFPLATLPENLIAYNRVALEWALQGKAYSELGWESPVSISSGVGSEPLRVSGKDSKI